MKATEKKFLPDKKVKPPHTPGRWWALLAPEKIFL